MPRLQTPVRCARSRVECITRGKVIHLRKKRYSKTHTQTRRHTATATCRHRHTDTDTATQGTRTYTETHTHTRRHTQRTRRHTRTHTRTHTHTHTHTQAHTQAHTHTHAHTHTRTRTRTHIYMGGTYPMLSASPAMNALPSGGSSGPRCTGTSCSTPKQRSKASHHMIQRTFEGGFKR